MDVFANELDRKDAWGLTDLTRGPESGREWSINVS